jgi:hypothetical protein
VSISGYPLDSLNTPPHWSELSNEQKIVLAPFSDSWNSMDAYSRRKWLAIAKRYPAMGAEEKIRTRNHMTEWVKLTPEERKRAREKYKLMNRSSPNKKATLTKKWREYQSLPNSERRRLRSAAQNQSKAVSAKQPPTQPFKKTLPHPTHPLTSPHHLDATP